MNRIQAMDLRSIDLNLLVVFEALLQHRSVTRGGDAIGLSQPAMSAALARLRLLFGDQLFVRSGAEMKPTPRALEVGGPVAEVLETIRGRILPTPEFDPSRARRNFTLVTPDIGEVHFVPALLTRLARDAPSVRLFTVAQPPQAAAAALESGGADLALGYFPDLQRPGFFQQKLFDNRHVCLVRHGHPAIGKTLTLSEYLAASHANVRPGTREHVFEQFLVQQGIQRRVVVELSHFMSLLPIIEGSDLIATVPGDLAEVCVRHAAVRIVPVPLDAPMIAIHQFWHERVHRDAASTWLRGVVRDIFMDRTPKAQG